MFKNWNLSRILRALSLGAVVALTSAPVQAADAAGTQGLGCVDGANAYCVYAASAVGWQLNLKTGGTSNAVALAGLALTRQYGTLPLGLGVYAGFGASDDSGGSYQGCLGVSITSWGLLCVGAQHITASGGVWQGMLTFAGQLTFAGTPSFVKAAAVPTS
jgi:hypothetical protein